MGLGHNTTIVRNGLVFYYDASNTEKSWRGEPTTNLYDFGYYQAEGGHTATRTVGDAPGLSTSVVDYHTITTSGSWISESARLIIWPTTTLAASTTFRVSFWARVTSKGSTTIKSAFYGNAVNNSHSLTTSWQRFSYSSTTHPAFRALEFGSDDGAITFQVAGIQWESKSVQTPYVKTSRSNTQAILDLTNNNTITANSLTYNVDGTFSFNGSTNNLSIGNFSGYSTNITCEAIFKTTSSATWKNIVCGPNGDLIFTVNTNLINFGCQGNSPIPHSNYSTTIVNTGNWFHAIATYDGSQVKIYINGALESTNNRTGSITAGAKHIGSAQGGVSEFFNGDISFVRIYNRALTATEVLQNFNAQRDRYGI